jgi:peptidoglycan/LPS O-acetylase OafA/YrhL
MCGEDAALRSTRTLGVMRINPNRAALLASYLVVLVYFVWPVAEHPTDIDNPVRQVAVIAFVASSLVALGTALPTVLLMIIAVLNGVVGLVTLAALSYAVFAHRLGSIDTTAVPAAFYFITVVPLIAAYTLFKSARSPTSSIEK